MIAAWMLYCVAIAILFAVVGEALERALHLAGRPTRWAWVVALAGSYLVPAAAWRRAAVDGRAVLVSDDVGPAVAGLWRPRIVLPEWALRLTDAERRLMLAHEDEHVRARDPWLLAAAAALVLLAPWNLMLWWQLG